VDGALNTYHSRVAARQRTSREFFKVITQSKLLEKLFEFVSRRNSARLPKYFFGIYQGRLDHFQVAAKLS
jgi:hypothetical protein